MNRVCGDAQDQDRTRRDDSCSPDGFLYALRLLVRPRDFRGLSQFFGHCRRPHGQGGGRHQRSKVHLHGPLRDRSGHHVDGGNEPIATFGDGLDEARILRGVAQRFAEPHHGSVQAVIKIHKCIIGP